MALFLARAGERSDLSDSSDRTRTTLTGRKLRPSPITHAWIWIILTVGVVILMTITLWVVHHATSSADPYVDVSGDWKVRWAQVPGPAAVYEANANEAMVRGDLDAASTWLSKALALNPQQPLLWVQMVCLSIAHEGPYTIDDNAISRLISGPLKDTVTVNDWVGLRSRLKADTTGIESWVSTCIGAASSRMNAETTPETLDTGEVSP